MPATDRELHDFLPKDLKDNNSLRKNNLIELILSNFIPKNEMSKSKMNHFLGKIVEKSIAWKTSSDDLKNLKEKFYQDKKSNET